MYLTPVNHADYVGLNFSFQKTMLHSLKIILTQIHLKGSSMVVISFARYVLSAILGIDLQWDRTSLGLQPPSDLGWLLSPTKTSFLEPYIQVELSEGISFLMTIARIFAVVGLGKPVSMFMVS